MRIEKARAWRKVGGVVGAAGFAVLVSRLLTIPAGAPSQVSSGPDARPSHAVAMTPLRESIVFAEMGGEVGSPPDDPSVAPALVGVALTESVVSPSIDPPPGVHVPLALQQSGEFASQDGRLDATATVIPLGEERVAVFTRDGVEHRVVVTYSANGIVLNGRYFTLSTKGKIPFTRIPMNATLTISSVEDLSTGERRMTAGAFGISGTMTSSREAAQDLCLELLREGCATVRADDGRKITIREVQQIPPTGTPPGL